MITIKEITNQNQAEIIDLAVNYLSDGKIVIYPTDTSYGIGGLLNSEYTLAQISKLKNRDNGKYYSAIVPNLDWIKQNLMVNTIQEDILNKYLPGKYTFILETKVGDKSTLGIRIPHQNILNQIAKKLCEPFTATSANIGGQPDSYSLNDLKEGILTRAKDEDILVLDGGPLTQGHRSTIVDLTKTPYDIIRQGSGIFETKEERPND